LRIPRGARDAAPITMATRIHNVHTHAGLRWHSIALFLLALAVATLLAVAVYPRIAV
jgi:hypothetical protein